MKYVRATYSVPSDPAGQVDHLLGLSETLMASMHAEKAPPTDLGRSRSPGSKTSRTGHSNDSKLSAFNR